jgi:hypothetical protein
MRRRRFLSDAENRALELGVDEIVGRLEWVPRGRTPALRNAWLDYRRDCLRWYRRLERAGRARAGVL